MQTERTPIVTDFSVLLSQVKEHLRVTHGAEDFNISEMIAAAAADIEASANIALLTQTVRVTTDVCPGPDVDLALGPVAVGATPTVQVQASDGSLTTLATGFWMTTGRRPVLHLTDTTITDRLVITYTAGLAPSAGALPADIRHAIADQACRMYGIRGDDPDLPMSTAPMTSRVIARYKRVRM